jgi:hypothetical protein
VVGAGEELMFVLKPSKSSKSSNEVEAAMGAVTGRFVGGGRVGEGDLHKTSTEWSSPR